MAILTYRWVQNNLLYRSIEMHAASPAANTQHFFNPRPLTQDVASDSGMDSLFYSCPPVPSSEISPSTCSVAIPCAACITIRMTYPLCSRSETRTNSKMIRGETQESNHDLEATSFKSHKINTKPGTSYHQKPRTQYEWCEIGRGYEQENSRRNS